MAAPASTQGSSSVIPGLSSSSGRWGRSGEPGSAFSGLTRGRGRGNGRGRGGKGGRGNGTPRDIKSGGDAHLDKAEPVQDNFSSPSGMKSSTVPAASVSASEKGLSSNSSRPKPSSRRVSRANSSVVAAAQPTVSVEASSPTASRPQNRRRRSQLGKGPTIPLATINVPALDDNMLRPNRPRVGPVPHSAPAKDTPPHLSNSFDIRNNIDALVERVRAVAMADNRPSTPGSHIDWAGDDDDSLPDLDDWGITTSTSIGEKPEMISPIIMDGLRPLPEPVIKPLTPPLGEQTVSPSLPLSKPGVEDDAIQPSTKLDGISIIQAPGTSSPTSAPSQQSLDSSKSQKSAAGSDSFSNTGISPSQVPSLNSSIPLQRTTKLLHPSLPPKPFTVSATHQRVRPAAIAMRNQSTTKNPSFKDIPSVKVVKSLVDSAEEPSKDPKVLGEVEVDKPAYPTETEERIVSASAEMLEKEQGLSDSIHAPSSQTSDEDNLFQVHKSREGLAASIHAPSALSESLSAPGDLSLYSSTSIGSRLSSLTHTRAHTVGRPPSFPRNAPVEHIPRFTRSGHSTPQGAYHGGYHARTHSTPPAGTSLSNHRIHATRPVITGDAISRLARTIGNSTISSPKSSAVGASTD